MGNKKVYCFNNYDEAVDCIATLVSENKKHSHSYVIIDYGKTKMKGRVGFKGKLVYVSNVG
jgi:hypothetical protein